MFKYKHCREILSSIKTAQLFPMEFKNNKFHHLIAEVFLLILNLGKHYLIMIQTLLDHVPFDVGNVLEVLSYTKCLTCLFFFLKDYLECKIISQDVSPVYLCLTSLPSLERTSCMCWKHHSWVSAEKQDMSNRPYTLHPSSPSQVGLNISLCFVVDSATCRARKWWGGAPFQRFDDQEEWQY